MSAWNHAACAQHLPPDRKALLPPPAADAFALDDRFHKTRRGRLQRGSGWSRTLRSC